MHKHEALYIIIKKKEIMMPFFCAAGNNTNAQLGFSDK